MLVIFLLDGISASATSLVGNTQDLYLQTSHKQPMRAGHIANIHTWRAAGRAHYGPRAHCLSLSRLSFPCSAPGPTQINNPRGTSKDCAPPLVNTSYNTAIQLFGRSLHCIVSHADWRCHPVNMIRSSCVVSTLGQSRRHWASIETAQGERTLYTGYYDDVRMTCMNL